MLVISQVSLLTQTYEWFTMLYIITFQKRKSLGEIMYKLSDDKEKQKFILMEKVGFGVYLSLVILVIAGKYTWLFACFWNKPQVHLMEDSTGFIILFIDEIVPLCTMIIMLFTLLWQLK